MQPSHFHGVRDWQWCQLRCCPRPRCCPPAEAVGRPNRGRSKRSMGQRQPKECLCRQHTMLLCRKLCASPAGVTGRMLLKHVGSHSRVRRNAAAAPKVQLCPTKPAHVHNAAQHSAAQRSIARHSTAGGSTAQHSTARHTRLTVRSAAASWRSSSSNRRMARTREPCRGEE